MLLCLALLFTSPMFANMELNEKCCRTPDQPFYTDANIDETRILFIFNSSSGLCESTLIVQNHKDVYSSRFDCVSQCNPDQGAPFCAKAPIAACTPTKKEVETASTSVPITGTEDNQEGGLPYLYDFDDCDISYFYNISSQKCEGYYAYNIFNRDDGLNYYLSDTYCDFDCGGFNETNVFENSTSHKTQ
ncbi:uncharacterized protein LOC125944847 isoform X1 [Dermacentor silvarum]|uniref:uncharacterized protein LOC125944847 isoform X1 n=1 Tax=Dermacentor silvarum TaxID=543639 RepID=UPI002100A2AE|nr:uncharacterized protein LOC125944847 isoform X1 [Dermacentor silvarum]